MPRKPRRPDPPPLRLEWRSPAELAENPRNWRTHPESQVSALADVISEVGWAGACLFNERTQRLIDGHARQKVALMNGTEKVPVLIGDWSEEQEAKILATLDPLAAMAEADAAKLDELLREIETSSQAVAEMLTELANEHGVVSDADAETEGQTQTVDEKFAICITCETEQQQLELLERFESEGLSCRALIV